MKTVTDLIDLWPTYREMSKDIDVKHLDTIRKWRERDSIPSSKLYKIWLAVNRKAKNGDKDFELITPEIIIRICRERK